MQTLLEFNEAYILEAAAILYHLIQRGGSTAQKNVKRELANLNILSHLEPDTRLTHLDIGIDLLEKIAFLKKAPASIKNQYNLTLTLTQDDFNKFMNNLRCKMISQLNNNQNIKQNISIDIDDNELFNILIKCSNRPLVHQTEQKKPLTKKEIILTTIYEHKEIIKVELVKAAGKKLPDSDERSFYSVIKNCVTNDLIKENEKMLSLTQKGTIALNDIPGFQPSRKRTPDTTTQVAATLNKTVSNKNLAQATTTSAPPTKKQRANGPTEQIKEDRDVAFNFGTPLNIEEFLNKVPDELLKGIEIPESFFNSSFI